MINLFNPDTLKMLANFIGCEKDRILYNGQIFQILEGNLKELLWERMAEDLGQKSSAQAKTRTAPINVFQKIVEKQTVIYNQPVVRTVKNGTEGDAELLAWYEEILQVNHKFNGNNQSYNAYLYALLQIALTDIDPITEMGRPFIRSIPNHQFLIKSASLTDPTSCDIVILCMPKWKGSDGKEREVFYVSTKYQFVIIDKAGEIIDELMAIYQQDGSNPYNTLPFVYNNASQNLAMPLIQTDNLDLAILIPLLLTDLNYATKFQAFSMFVGIDIDTQKIEISPNSILSLKSDANGGDKPSFNVIKPTVDISAVLNLASSEMSLWLTSKGIRPGSVGQLGPDSFASGISKIVDESDTYENVKKQIAVYQKFEKEFWEKLLKVIHPFWVTNRKIANTHNFSPDAYVETIFSEPKPLQSRSDLIKELESEVAAGFTTVRIAVKKLNPELDDDEIDELIKAAEADRVVRVKPQPVLQLTDGKTANNGAA